MSMPGSTQNLRAAVRAPRRRGPRHREGASSWLAGQRRMANSASQAGSQPIITGSETSGRPMACSLPAGKTSGRNVTVEAKERWQLPLRREEEAASLPSLADMSRAVSAYLIAARARVCITWRPGSSGWMAAALPRCTCWGRCRPGTALPMGGGTDGLDVAGYGAGDSGIPCLFRSNVAARHRARGHTTGRPRLGPDDSGAARRDPGYPRSGGHPAEGGVTTATSAIACRPAGVGRAVTATFLCRCPLPG